MSKKINIALMGLGWVGEHRHIPSLLRHPDFHLSCVLDRNEKRAAEIAEKYKIPHYAKADSFIGLDKLPLFDAVSLATPPMTHARLATEALKAGKHVITEKPFAMSPREGKEVCEIATQTGKKLAIVHNFQFSRAFKKLEKDIASGTLGDMRGIAATQLGNPLRRLPSWYEELPCGLFYDESPHFFYLLHRLTGGKLDLLKGYKIPSKEGKNTPDSIHLLYEGPSKLPVTIDCQFNSSVSEWYLTVTGSKAMGIVDIFRDIYIRLPNDHTHGALDILKTSFYAISQHVWQHIPNGISLIRGHLDYGNDEVFDRFAKAIITGESLSPLSQQEAMAVLTHQHKVFEIL